jgi:hypothetical protein
MYMACCFVVHSSLHWTDQGSDDISLWPFAVKHAVWLYNRVPNHLSGLTLLESLKKSKADHRDLLCLHVWGCPAIALDPKLQNDQKPPKWNRRACVGQFLGYSDEHLSFVANVRHLCTGHVSPQSHVIFDDLLIIGNRSLQLANNAMILASIVERAVSICSCDFQRMGISANVITNPVQLFTHDGSTGFLCSYIPAKSASG